MQTAKFARARLVRFAAIRVYSYSYGKDYANMRLTETRRVGVYGKGK